MFEGIQPWVVQGGALGLLLVAIALVLLGKIVPRSTLEQQRRDLLAWKDAFEKASATNAAMAEHMGQLVRTVDVAADSMQESQRLMVQALGALRKDPV